MGTKGTCCNADCPAVYVQILRKTQRTLEGAYLARTFSPVTYGPSLFLSCVSASKQAFSWIFLAVTVCLLYFFGVDLRSSSQSLPPYSVWQLF